MGTSQKSSFTAEILSWSYLATSRAGSDRRTYRILAGCQRDFGYVGLPAEGHLRLCRVSPPRARKIDAGVSSQAGARSKARQCAGYCKTEKSPLQRSFSGGTLMMRVFVSALGTEQGLKSAESAAVQDLSPTLNAEEVRRAANDRNPRRVRSFFLRKRANRSRFRQRRANRSTRSRAFVQERDDRIRLSLCQAFREGGVSRADDIIFKFCSAS